MRRSIIFLFLAAFGLLFAAASAFMQGGSRPRLDVVPGQQPKIANQVEMPRMHLNRNRLHKLIITDKEAALYNELAKARAIRNEIDYGSYKLIVVDEEAVGGRAALESMPISPRDDQSMMVFNGYLIDTSDPQPLSREVPAQLKQSRMSAALTGAVAPGRGLYIIQFVGPVQDAWLELVKKSGTEIITYAPNNGYVVRADDRAAGELVKMKENSSAVQWIGDFHPAYKLTPQLQAMVERGDSQPIRVTVQLIDGVEGNLKAQELRSLSPQYFNERRVLKYRNVTVVIPASQLVSLARSDAVLAIGEDHERSRTDEAQGQIVAGNLTGNGPSGPGYLNWLESKGFNASQFGSFAVNVADDSDSLAGHPDLPGSRVAFEHNPTDQTGPQHGHGFLNAHIIGGFNDGTGPASEDASGFNYGLGIVPWARVGVTAIFGNGAFSPSDWEEIAYGQSARISSNSWDILNTWYYDTYAQEYDSIVRDAQRGTPGNQGLAVVFSAGNYGQFGQGYVTTPGAAKNVITVGASENVRPTGLDGCTVANSGADSANDVAYFSSRGPVNPSGGDGRIKPDIVAPGTHIQAGIPQSNYDGMWVCDKYWPAGQTLYSWSSGTSHATPAVAGGAALVYQDFLNHGKAAPSPAMIKAMLVNSASYLTGAGANDTLPSKSQGMGLMNLGRTFDGTPRLLTDQTRVFGSSGETYRLVGSVAATDQPLRITLAWTDAPGSTVGAPWVNDLDLEVTINGQTYRGNVFSGANSTAGGTPDGKNNVESVFLPAGLSGNFLVTVRAANIAGDGVPGNDDTADQDFALVIYNANSASLDSPIIEVRPAKLSFTAAIGGDTPASQMLGINNDGADTLDWTASDDAPWLTINQTSGTAPSMLAVSVSSDGLTPGTYNATITIRSSNAFNSPVGVPVELTVLPVFTTNPSSLSFGVCGGYSLCDGSSLPDQTVQIVNNDSISRGWTVSDDASWLTVRPASGTGSSALTVSVDITGLPAGTYNGTITISPTHKPNLIVTIPVTLRLYAPLNVLPSNLVFGAGLGGPNPTDQMIAIIGSSNTYPPFNWVGGVDVPWLKVTPANGITPSSVRVSAVTGNLSGGTYNGTITLRAVNATGTPLNLPPATVPVFLTIDRVANGVFEGVPDPWVLSGLATGSTGAYKHGGKGYLLMGGSNSSGGSAYQEVVVPSRSSLNLSFWLNVTSNETTATEQNDLLLVEIRNTRGRLLRTLATFSNLNRSAPGSYMLAGDYNLASFAGQTVRVQFRTITNSSLLTSFRLDDVSIR